MAMTHPGMFLSQPPTATNPSKPSHPITVSTESAITSRETSEYFIPSLPMEIPSEIVMVLKITALPPAALAPWAALSASTLMCMLHGVTMDHVDAMPIWGFLKSSSLNPTARSMARLGARSSPSVTMLENLRIFDIYTYFVFVTPECFYRGSSALDSRQKHSGMTVLYYFLINHGCSASIF